MEALGSVDMTALRFAVNDLAVLLILYAVTLYVYRGARAAWRKVRR